jgi:protein-disulfide isomerase
MSVSKREEIRAQRLQKKRKQRMTAMVGTGVVILVVVLLIGLPSVIDRYRPAGEYVTITPVAYPLADGRAIGNPNAPVVIEVFEDFQCSACKIFTESTEAELLATDYIANGQVYYIVRQFPFEDNSSSIKASDQAANASMCANEQGRFWDYHAMLYANQNTSSATAYSDRRLIAFAEALGLEMGQFRSCFKDNTYAAEIQDDLDRATEYGVNGTPSVFVNGQRITPGYVPALSDLVSSIEAVLPLTE